MRKTSTQNFNCKAIYLLLLSFLWFSCEKQPELNDQKDNLVGKWKLVKVSGNDRDYHPPGNFFWESVRQTTSNDTLIRITQHYRYYNRVTASFNEFDKIYEYKYSIVLEIYENQLFKISESTYNHADSTTNTGVYNSYYRNEGSSYIAKLSFIEPEPLDFNSKVFFKADIPLIYSEQNGKPFIRLMGGFQFRINGTATYAYTFKKI